MWRRVINIMTGNVVHVKNRIENKPASVHCDHDQNSRNKEYISDDTEYMQNVLYLLA